MTDPLTLDLVVKLVSSLGLPGVILVIWYFDRRDQDRILAQYREDMNEQRQMYKDNVQLVTQCLDTQRDLKDVVVLNTQQWCSAKDLINSNQFCPMVRLKKEITGVSE
jgi:hypothetical protein